MDMLKAIAVMTDSRVLGVDIAFLSLNESVFALSVFVVFREALATLLLKMGLLSSHLDS